MKLIIKAALGIVVGLFALSAHATPVSAATYCTDYTYGVSATPKTCVKELQNLVNKTHKAYGYVLGSRTPLVLDGVYGSKTQSAVLNIQAHSQLRNANGWFNLTPDGIAGKQTWSIVCKYGDYNWTYKSDLIRIGCVRETYNTIDLWQYLGYKGTAMHY
jgi:hypothetical protein